MLRQSSAVRPRQGPGSNTNYSAVALNLIRLDAWWSGHPLDRTRTSHLARLQLTLAA